MTKRIKYRDIPEEERKQLAAEVRRKPSFYSTIIVAMIFAWVVSDRIAESIAPRQNSFGLNLLTNIAAMLCLSGGFAWALMGPGLRRAVENKKNA